MSQQRDLGATLPPSSANENLSPLQRIEADPSLKQRYEAHRKSLLRAYLFWLLLGWLGGHRFYLGYVASGIFLILLSGLGLTVTLVSPIGLFLLVPPGLWLLVDGFIIPAIVRHQNSELIAQILR